MNLKARWRKHRPSALAALNIAIEALNFAEQASSTTPAGAIFSLAGVIITTVRDSMINDEDYVELGKACSDVCVALDRGLKGKLSTDLDASVYEAIRELTATMEDIQRKIIKSSKRNLISRFMHARSDKENIAKWKWDLHRFLQLFSTELAINTHVTVADARDCVMSVHTVVSEVQRDTLDTHTMVSDIHRNMLKGQEEADHQHRSTQTGIPDGFPPPPPRVCFGREELIEKIVRLAERLSPVALIGAGGIGKTSIALTALHDDRIKQRFGDNRRFIRCDRFPPTRVHLLRQLSKVIGAGIENPEDLAPLRPLLSSQDMFIILDNAESILDAQGANAEEIYDVVEELGRFNNICLCITSRITTVPPGCEIVDVPTLFIQAARDVFYQIYPTIDQPDLIDNILEQLEFHPLSITLLATVAQQDNWDVNRLNKEWESRGTDVLHTQHNKSLATTVEISLASPMFRRLGPEARDLLGVVAFFPQGVDEINLDWLFPDISDRTNIFDTFCILSLTYRSDGFITMLAPLRDYFRPRDPLSSPYLCATKQHYFNRLSVDVYPGKPGYEEARWIVSEDVNVEHLLNDFTSVDPGSDDVWDACANFMRHLIWHKRRPVMLGPRIEGLPDDHHSKPDCLYELSQLLNLAGNHAESKRFLTHTLKVWRERKNDFRLAQTLRLLANVNRLLGLDKEGIRQVKEALEIFERLDNTVERAHSLQLLAWLLYGDSQLAAAEEAASKVIDLLSDESEQFLVIRCHRFLGYVHLSKGNAEMAISQFEKALGIATSFNWHFQLFWNRYSLAEVAFCEGKFDDASSHIERAKSHAVNHAYFMGRAMQLQASIFYRQRKIEEAKSEALGAAEVLEGLEASQALEDCRALLRQIELGATTPETDEDNGLPEAGIERPRCWNTPHRRSSTTYKLPFWV